MLFYMVIFIILFSLGTFFDLADRLVRCCCKKESSLCELCCLRRTRMYFAILSSLLRILLTGVIYPIIYVKFGGCIETQHDKSEFILHYSFYMFLEAGFWTTVTIMLILAILAPCFNYCKSFFDKSFMVCVIILLFLFCSVYLIFCIFVVPIAATRFLKLPLVIVNCIRFTSAITCERIHISDLP